jgi:predicted  nucleic acid-binding Zn-ribbon protein
MTEEAKGKVESRLDELTVEFNELSEKFKAVQADIAAKQRNLGAIRERLLQIQGAFAELKKLEDEPVEG